MTDYHTNIIHVYLAATEKDIREGIGWYEEVNAIATELANGDTWKGAGVISAYSVNQKWERNIMLATDTLISGTPRTDALGYSVKAATRILNGEHTLDVLKGDKTRAFASAIADPANSMIATIDRHAHDIAMGRVYTDKERKIGKRLFYTLSDAYVEASNMCGISVAQMQAATWVAWRRMKGIK